MTDSTVDPKLVVAPFHGSPAEWDAFVTRHDGWTHYHTFGWKDLIEREFAHECLYLAARDGEDHLQGILPLVRVRGPVFGHFLVSMPFLNYGGPLGTPGAIRLLCDEARNLAHRDGVSLVELRSRVPLEVSLDVTHRKVTVILDLPSNDPTQLFDSFKAKLRSQIRRPMKEGLTTRFGSDQIDPFYRVFARQMRDLGTPVHKRQLFHAMAHAFGESVWFGCVYAGDKPVAGGCGFHWEGEFEMTWAASSTAHKRLAPNMLLYWSFMQRAILHGLTRFNFGRCTPGSGTHRFKLQWGGREQRLWWYTSSSDGVDATPSPTDARYAWGPTLWSRLPVPVANLIGPSIVRWLP